MTLLSPRDISKEIPLGVKQMCFVERSRDHVRNILEGIDKRLLLVVGPCSVHDSAATKEYAKKLSLLASAVSDTFLVLMRSYYEKPRTIDGWKGMLYDPHLDGSCDINAGLRKTRRLLSDLTDLELPIATEILEPASFCYFGDYLSWGCVGARTASSQIHRQAASGLPIPIGFKNNTDGNIDIAVQGVVSAGQSHTYYGINDAGCMAIINSDGNPDCHIVLRGGENTENYDSKSVMQSIRLLEKWKLPTRLLIDCSHGNSKRVYHRQADVLEDVVSQILEGNDAIRGMVLESNLFAGSQEIPADPSSLKYGVSVTDPCLDWSMTEKLILSARGRLLFRKSLILNAL